MKNIVRYITAICICTIIFPVISFANTKEERIISIEIQKMDNGDYIEVITSEAISQRMSKAMKLKSGSKIVNYKNASGNIMWYVKETGTFSYTGSISECIDDEVHAESYNSAWKITSRSSDRYGNTATGNATAKQYFDGSVIKTISRTVNVSCSATGEIY